MPTMSDDISAWRKAHRLVDGMIRAEEGRNQLEMSLDRRKRRFLRVRTGSWAGSEKSEGSVLPPYKEHESENEITVGGMGHWYDPEDFGGSLLSSPSRPTFEGIAASEHSSVISTSPRTSLYYGSDSEKE